MYLSETGSYYNGTSIYGVNVKYCVGTNWADNLNVLADELLAKVEPNTNTNTNVMICTAFKNRLILSLFFKFEVNLFF